LTDLNSLKTRIDEKDQTIESTNEAKNSERRDFERQISKLQNDIQLKNDQVDGLTANNNTLKEIHNKLKQQILSSEQKFITMEADLLKQNEEKDDLKRTVKMDKSKEGHEVKTLNQKIDELQEELRITEQGKQEREEKVKALFEESKKLKQVTLTQFNIKNYRLF
jgi:chromosome segregation ATPase